MRRRIGLALSALLLTTPLAPAQAKDDVLGMLTLQGSRTAWVDITLSKKVTLDYDKTTFQGGKQFVGFYAEDLRRPPAERFQEGHTLGAVQLRDFHGPGAPGITQNLSPGVSRMLEPGRYRFYLLADGPAVMRLAFQDGAQLTVRPRNPASAAAAVRTSIAKNALEAANAQPLLVSGQRAVVTSTIMLGPVRRAFVGGIHACVARSAECGDYGVDAGSFPGFVIYPLGEFDLVYGTLYLPGVIKPGQVTARQGAQNATTIEYASAAAFTLSLT